MALRHLVEGGNVRETRPTRVNTVRLFAGCGGHHVSGIQTLCRFDFAIVATDRKAHRFFLATPGGVFREFFDALVQNAHGFVNFGDTYRVTVVAVAGVGHGHVKLQLVINAIGVGLTDVEVDAAGTKYRAGASVSDGVFGGENADALAAFEHDDVLRKESFVVLHCAFEVLEESLDAVDKVFGNVEAAATRSKEVGGEARPGDFFENVMDHFAFLEAEQQAGLAAKVAAEAAEEHEVAGDSAEFRKHHADVFALFRNADVHAFFKCNYDSQVVLNGRQIVLAVRHRNVLEVTHGFRLLFHAAVDIAKVRHNFHDGFAVHTEGEAQCTVGTRVLRTHVDEKFFGIGIAGNLESRGKSRCHYTGLLMISGWVKSLRKG